jgi:proteasome lid subunit RPN8/RPN11
VSPERSARRTPVPINDQRRGQSLLLPESVVAATERLLRTYGADGDEHEGIVYLGGVEADDASVALIAFAPEAETTWGSFRTGSDANNRLVGALMERGLRLVGQVHSHPGGWTDHSDGDDAGALVRFEGYWSLVVPRYGREGMRLLTECGVHLFTAGAFARLTAAAVAARVRVLPAASDLRTEVRDA